MNFCPLTCKYAGNPQIPLIICEAITKADAVAQWRDAEVCLDERHHRLPRVQ